MEIILIVINLMVSIFTFVLLAAVASLLSKIASTSLPTEELPPISKEQRTPPTYADLALMGYDGVSPRPPNEDGTGGLISN